jgi:hypothetical protein
LSCPVGLVFLPVRGARGKFLHAVLRCDSGEKSARDALLTGTCNFDKQHINT